MSTQNISLTESLRTGQTFNNECAGCQIIHVIRPFSSIPSGELSLSPDRLVKIRCIEMIKSGEYEALRAQLPFLEGLDKEAALHTLSIYDMPHDEEHLEWSAQLTMQQLHGDLTCVNERVDQLYQRVMHPESYCIESRESNGHSKSFFLIDQLSGERFAILKQSGSYKDSAFILKGSSFDRLNIPGLTITSPVYEHEFIGYEQDQLFGLNHTPTTLAVKFVNEKGQEVLGILQEYIHNSKAGSELHHPAGAEKLINYSKSHVHQVALSGMFKGLSAGHRDNYLFADKVFEIDLEEMLLPFNRLDREKREKSIIFCRMWLLGLPQCSLPFDRASLTAISHPSFPSLLQAYQKQASRYSEMSEGSWAAQRERLEKMQELAKDHLAQSQITLTPRDMFFELFGGRHLWDITRQKGFPAPIAFAHAISDPYQQNNKDPEHPENIPESPWLNPESGKPLEIVQFFRILDALEASSLSLNFCGAEEKIA